MVKQCNLPMIWRTLRRTILSHLLYPTLQLSSAQA